MLGAEEAVRQAVESREAQVKEKADSLEQAEARHKWDAVEVLGTCTCSIIFTCKGGEDTR